MHNSIEDDEGPAPTEENNEEARKKRKQEKKLSGEEEQKELEVKSDSDLMKGTEKTHLTASSVRLVFLCGIAYLLMTVWKTGVEKYFSTVGRRGWRTS